MTETLTQAMIAALRHACKPSQECADDECEGHDIYPALTVGDVVVSLEGSLGAIADVCTDAAMRFLQNEGVEGMDTPEEVTHPCTPTQPCPPWTTVEFTPIHWNGYRSRDNITSLGQDDADAITDLLMGHKVTKVAEDHLVLDDGTLLRLVGHDGGCSCGAGDYDLTVLNGTDNIITRVELHNDPKGDGDGYDKTGVYEIFVFTGEEKINLARFEGDDGNGYYGTGYHLLVQRPVS